MNRTATVEHGMRGQGIEHEDVRFGRGRRSGLLIAVAVHDTTIGPALGGCRLWGYASAGDAIDDALRLSRGMTFKNALAGLPSGGGKAVIALAAGERLDAERRRAAFLDLGDLVDAFGGSYRTAEDVGTASADMAVVAERTEHVVGLPAESGGQGDPAEFTARGVLAALGETLRRTTGSPDPRGRTITVAGLGQVGFRLARTLAEAGARLTVTDVNPSRRADAEAIGARWVDPAGVHRVPCDVFMPAGVGGMLSDTVIAELASAAVVGPANNQLATPDGGALLAARGILYAPDYLVNAGGVIHLGAEGTPEEIAARIDGISHTLELVFDRADREGITTDAAADRIVVARLTAERSRRRAADPR
ncbi:MAG: Leu/Phe/Val dehydrogenase [Mycetocola reblochoni]|uniref:Leu/Phe/Val dehydrogenase n=1 Tax=Mycetocola reblochoni TaxID=331618 RepID=UPI003F99E992